MTVLFSVLPFGTIQAQSIDSVTVLRSLHMPFDPNDSTDSDFLTQLLLSHGLLLDTGDKDSVGSSQYQRLIRSIRNGTANSSPDISDVHGRFVLSHLKGTTVSGAPAIGSIENRPIEHRLVWWIDSNPPEPETIIGAALPIANSAQTSSASSGISLTRQPDPSPDPSPEPAPDPAPEKPSKKNTNIDLPEPTPRTSVNSQTPLQPPTEARTNDIPTKGSNPNKTKPFLTVNDDVPAGFEALSGPQFMFVDVFFNDEPLGSVGITVTDDTVLIEDPEELAVLMSDTVSDPQLINWLSTPLPANGHLACYAPNDPTGCGQISAAPLAVIYNAVLLRLDVFVMPSSQQAGIPGQRRYLMTPVDEASAIFSLYGVASELSSGPSRVDLSGSAILSYGRGNLSSNLHFNDETDRRTIETLKLTHHLDDYDLEVGTFGFSSGGALNEVNLIGVGFSTSFKTRLDLEQAFSSQLQIYLPRRSVVQILIDDRIYSGASYTAGNQVLDTSGLPDGTYEVEIIVNDPVNGQRSERRLFTKSALIPPTGEWVISATAGALRDSTQLSSLPQASDIHAAGFNVARRLGEHSSYRLGVLQFDDISIAHSEFLYLGKNLSFNLALSVGEHDLSAASVQSLLRFGDQHLGLSAGHFSSAIIATEESAESGFLVPENTRIDFSYHRSLPWLSYGARVGLRREADLTGISPQRDQETETLSLYAQRPVLRSRHRRGFLGFRYQRDENDSLAQLSLNLYFGRGDWSANTGVTLVDSDNNDTDWQTKAAASWSSDTQKAGTIKAGAYATNSNAATTYGFDTELRHAWFRANASSDVALYDGRGRTRNSIASFSAYAGVDRFGASLGGSDFAQSGLIVDVSGEPAGESFDVMVNSARVKTARIGSPQFIGLQPFKHYEVQLRPTTVMGNGLGKANHSLTLFPGNVGRISLQAKRQALLIAMVADESGNIISNAVVRTSSNTLVIDESGILQAEVHEGEQLTIRRKDGSECIVTVEMETSEEVVVPDLPVICSTPEL
ncbi:MAG: TcfC E-set like domain-containing protein [Granulosicoccus sp.]